MKAEEIWSSNEYVDYADIVSCFGNIIIEVQDDDYEGDIRFLLEKDGKFGFNIIGFGSCSGCDWLQGCDTMDEKQDLVDTIEREIEWFDTLDELKERFRTKDWELEYSWHQEETKRFIDLVLNFNK